MPAGRLRPAPGALGLLLPSLTRSVQAQLQRHLAGHRQREVALLQRARPCQPQWRSAWHQVPSDAQPSVSTREQQALEASSIGPAASTCGRRIHTIRKPTRGGSPSTVRGRLSHTKTIGKRAVLLQRRVLESEDRSPTHELRPLLDSTERCRPLHDGVDAGVYNRHNSG